MRIEKAKLFHLNIHFKVNFVHAMASRSYSDSIIVMLEGNGFKGYGEAVVRDYVSGSLGEKTDILSNARTAANEIIKLLGVKERDFTAAELKRNLKSLKIENSHLPVLCAVETALLDFLCGKEEKDIYELLTTQPLRERVIYGGTLPILPLKAAEQLLNGFKKLKITNLRVKLNNNLEYSKEILKKARHILGENFDLRVDANASWNLESAFSNLEICREYGIFAVEQPFKRKSEYFPKLLNSPQAKDFHFVADESALTEEDIYDAKQNRSFDMINIRLSKNGGLFKSMLLAEKAEEYGIKYQVGCHVGETGILSSVGRVLASLVKDPIYTDGSYDEYLLTDNITKANLTFGSGGEARIIRGRGLGFKIDERKLRRLSIETTEYF